MKGNKLNGMAVQDAKQLFFNAQDPYFKKVLQHHNNQHLSEHNLGYLYKTMIAAENSGVDCKVLYTSLGGFDTYFNQIGRQEKLFSVYGESIDAFVKYLEKNDTFKNTLIWT